MRTVDFIGRNYVLIRLPRIDCSEIMDSAVASATTSQMSDPDHVYLGAWHRDLIPRLINKVSFYPRSNAHKLFEYTGYDIFIHNILFGNAHKEMNDLMAGEDKFELCYDPYFVDGAALGLSSFKGIDTFREFGTTPSSVDANGLVTYTDLASSASAGTDGLVDYFQVDSTMDNFEFREFYRKGVWFETPVARNYHARHSIHSRRMIHQAKDISIPLDILPFGYSVASSLPSAALSGECGFIKIEIFEDWVDRAFYLTKVSDVPSLHPLVNHLHYKEGDRVLFEGSASATGEADVIGADDPREGWVNEASLGRYGDPTFVRETPDKDDSQEKSGVRFSQPGNVVGGAMQTRREGIIPSKFDVGADGQLKLFRRQAGSLQGKTAMGSNASVVRKGVWNNVRKTSTVNDPSAIDADDTYAGYNVRYLWKLSEIDAAYNDRIKNELSVKLLQVGYQTLPCIRDLLSKMPNIYITTEWSDETHGLNDTSISINNDLYIQAIILWFLPEDAGNIQSMRLYPCHLQDHELPVVAGLRLNNEQSQGNSLYDWRLLNEVTPAQMNLNPLLENMGIISFSPKLTANSLPQIIGA